MIKRYNIKRINGNPHPLDTHPKAFVRYRVVVHDGRRRWFGKIEREKHKDAWQATVFDGCRIVCKGRFKSRGEAAKAVVLHFMPGLTPRCKVCDGETGARCQRMANHGSERHWHISDELYVVW